MVTPKILAHFQVKTPQEITWSHAINNKKALSQALSAPNIMMVEGDISLDPANRPIMAHPPVLKSDLLFTHWIKSITTSRKGAKLDFKDPQVVPLCLQKLNSRSSNIPLVLNADLFLGPGGGQPLFETKKFLSQCLPCAEKAILSIGWTTEYLPEKQYSPSMIAEALRKTRHWPGEITFCLRACYLRSSWLTIQPLLQNSNHSLTIWESKNCFEEYLRSTDFIPWTRKHLNPHRTFVDCPL